MQLSFFKYHGAGNDFIIADNRNFAFRPVQSTVEQLCDRHFGIGADGLILLEKDDHTDFMMRYFNPDGLEATMCGNGGRCIVSFAAFLGIIRKKTIFTATDGRHEAEILSHQHNTDFIKLKMNDVKTIVNLEKGFFLNSGSPHLVRFENHINQLDVTKAGRKYRDSGISGFESVNVNFVENIEGKLCSRTYERGVENETLACGTGAVAIALAAHLKGLIKNSPAEIHAAGGKLTVHFEAGNNIYSNIWLEGPAERVFSGIINLPE
ncbi:MAG: diaminopimelate epimerase [Sphingobacteriia bacterium]|nr:diaminopimelate epimerase [Sphingobacteriia bacterium]